MTDTGGAPARAPHTFADRIWAVRDGFWAWRASRPFWGGLWCLLGGIIIGYLPATAFRVILIAGANVFLGILMGVLVAVMGLFLWFTPQLRQVVGVLAVLFSVVSLITSDYGGLLVGLILGTIGGAMGFAWTPVARKPS